MKQELKRMHVAVGVGDGDSERNFVFRKKRHKNLQHSIFCYIQQVQLENLHWLVVYSHPHIPILCILVPPVT
jgi:hypothetical protein